MARDIGQFDVKRDGWYVPCTITLVVGASSAAGDQASYTHKLDLGATVTVDPFIALPRISYLHGVGVIGALDFRVTGLPSKGDEVPKGERVFLSGAKPAVLSIGLDFPVAPLRPM
ncbi:MAG TPA: hypothetical protein VFW98_18400 [Gemmatimonadaceae bacterium]|nr:hypothetical protein [Gemmatimonadaceae bacterium]